MATEYCWVLRHFWLLSGNCDARLAFITYSCILMIIDLFTKGANCSLPPSLPPSSASVWFNASEKPSYNSFWLPVLQSSLYRGIARKEKPRGHQHGLTQQKRQEIKEAFELFDTDGSGTEINLGKCIGCLCSNFFLMRIFSFNNRLQGLLMQKSWMLQWGIALFIFSFVPRHSFKDLIWWVIT